MYLSIVVIDNAMSPVEQPQKKSKSPSIYGDHQLVRTNITKVLRWILAILVVLVMWTGISVVEQTQYRHKVYKEIRTSELQLQALRTEEQRLMIEQQTFSATPQVASRAVNELGMYFPTGSSRRVLTPQVNPMDANDAADTAKDVQ